MITTVTLNPMLDKTVYVDAVRPGKVTRASKTDLVVGGKGVNVSRQIGRLGSETLATGFLGGEIGALLQRLLDAAKIPHDFVQVSGMTREGVTYREADGRMTAVFEPPHYVTEAEAGKLVAHCQALLSRSTWIVCSGSSPSREADGTFEAILASARQTGVPCVLDSYGEVFKRAIKSAPTLAKPNKDEFEQTFGVTLANDTDYRKALDTMLGLGVRYCIITSGGTAFYAATESEAWKIVPPAVRAVNPTGSGDSMVAAIVFGLTEGWQFERCLRFGAAAGAANARVWDVAASTYEEIAPLADKVQIAGWK